MGMPVMQGEWTAEMVRAIPDDNNRYQVVDGELFVTPGPSWRHGDVVLGLAHVLWDYLERNPVGHLKVSPQDIEMDPKTLVEPDLFVVPLVEGKKPRKWEDVRKLLLVIEVLSPSTARLDRQVKLKRYKREGVPECWIVDAAARLIERWTLEDERPSIHTDTVEWAPAGVNEPMVIDLPAFFADAID